MYSLRKRDVTRQSSIRGGRPGRGPLLVGDDVGEEQRPEEQQRDLVQRSNHRVRRRRVRLMPQARLSAARAERQLGVAAHLVAPEGGEVEDEAHHPGEQRAVHEALRIRTCSHHRLVLACRCRGVAGGAHRVGEGRRTRRGARPGTRRGAGRSAATGCCCRTPAPATGISASRERRAGVLGAAEARGAYHAPLGEVDSLGLAVHIEHVGRGSHAVEPHPEVA